MIKTLQLKNQDEILLALGSQDRKLRALEKNFKVTVFVKYDEAGSGALLSIKGTHSRVDKALAKLQKDLADGAIRKPLDLVKDSRPFVDNIVFRPVHARPVEARSENQKNISNPYLPMISFLPPAPPEPEKLFWRVRVHYARWSWAWSNA